MHPDVQKLLKVQKVDQSIARIRRDLDSIPKERTRREAALAKVRAEHDAVLQRQQKSEVDARANELAIRQADDEIKKLETRLNTVKNNAEYQATLLQIESVKRDRARSEEEGLALIDASDALKAQVAESARRLAAEEQVFAEFNAKSDKLTAERGVELEKAGVGRDELVAVVPPDLMGKYERVFAARDGLAVCAVEGSTCTGCYTSIPPNLQVKLQGGSSVVICNSCQRILYLPE